MRFWPATEHSAYGLRALVFISLAAVTGVRAASAALDGAWAVAVALGTLSLFLYAVTVYNTLGVHKAHQGALLQQMVTEPRYETRPKSVKAYLLHDSNVNARGPRIEGYDVPRREAHVYIRTEVLNVDGLDTAHRIERGPIMDLLNDASAKICEELDNQLQTLAEWDQARAEVSQ